MKFILLVPILMYLWLMLVNMNLLRETQSINLFWAQTIEAPIFMFSWFFIVLYAVLVYIIYSWVNSVQAYKIRKFEREIVNLKSQLYDEQKDLLDSIKSDYSKQFESFKKDNDRKMQTLVQFNEYTIEKVLDETNWNFTKYRKETQKLLSNVQVKDSWIVEKLKEWGSK